MCIATIGKRTGQSQGYELGHAQNTCETSTQRYEIVVLLPSSELTKGNNKRDVDACTDHLRQKTMAGGRFKLPIISMLAVRNIKCWYSFC